MTLCISIATIDFDTQACMLRVNGRNIAENQYVKVSGKRRFNAETESHNCK